MILDPGSTPGRALHQFLISVVVPRPIAFVSTAGSAGHFNVAPFSYFNLISTRPPLLGIAIGLRAGAPKDTLRNIRESGDFVINVVDESLAARMVQTSGEWPAEVDEFELSGLTALASELVRAPRVQESPIQLECRLHREVDFGEATLVVGELVRAHARDELITDGTVDPIQLRPLARLGGDAYATLGRVLHLARPRVTPADGRAGA
jgi:flavin reductase (DIM6/NTAB) family NADH-FMN oxidoreductase RutF